MIGSTGASSTAKLDRNTYQHSYGFINRGNDCFLCAALQTVAHDAPLRDYLLGSTYADGSLAKALKEVLTQLQTPNAGPVDPRGVRDAVAVTAPQFEGDGPGDASELLAWLLSGLHDELRIPACSPSLPVCLTTEASQATENPLVRDTTHTGAWLAYWRTNSSEIANMRHGMQCTTSVCLECHRHSCEFSPFSIVSLSLPKDRSDEVTVELQRCISSWCEPTTEPTVVFCSHCNDFRHGTQHRTISRFPPYLAFHIQRLDEHAPPTAVICPRVLSPQAICTRVATDSIGGGGTSVRHGMPTHPNGEYELHAVTHVALDSATGINHYYTCCHQDNDDGWLCFDDEDVRAVDERRASSGVVHMACFRFKPAENR